MRPFWRHVWQKWGALDQRTLVSKLDWCFRSVSAGLGADFGPMFYRREPILARFWIDFGPMLVGFGTIFDDFDRIEEASSSIAKLSSATRMLDFLENSKENRGFAALPPSRC